MSLLNGGPSGNGGFDLDAWTAGDRSFPASGHTSPGRNNPGLPNISSGAPYLSGSMMNSHLHQREGDWICHGCSTVNFAKRTRCTKCGSLKQKRATEIGGPSNDGAPFSTQPGLFKRGDWPCTHCGNVNWARRDKCNVCNALKPFITEAPRTGRGGGHYDLQDPHDRQQHLSDEVQT